MQSFTIATWRKDRNVSQEVLAKKLGVTSKTVRNWETGETPLKKIHLYAIAHALEVDVSQIKLKKEVAD